MIEKLSRSDWASLSDSVTDQLGPIFDRGGAALGPTGQKLAVRALKKVSLSSGKSVDDIATVVALLHLAGDHDDVVAAADVLTAVPFTGNWTIFESVREVFALAVRSLAFTGGDPGRFVQRLTFGENDGEVGAPVRSPQLDNRLEGQLLKDSARDDHTVGPAGTHTYNVCIDVLELALMWSLGGSTAWPPARIDSELAVCAGALRELAALR